MKIPKKIKVAGKTYKVIYPYVFQERTDNLGQSNHIQQKILIANFDKSGDKLADETVDETFMHEILHCVDWAYMDSQLREKIGEDGLACVANGLYQALKDNNLLK